VTTKAKGPDNIPNVVLKTCPKRLAPALRYIFQVSSDLASHPNPSYYPLRMTCSKTTTLDHRAFDTVSHNSLLNKMKCYGVDGNINHWLRDFLTNRTMQVVVDDESSEPTSVDSGVPQGTVLCHINDLPDHVKSTVRLFADDCLLYRCIRSVRDYFKKTYMNLRSGPQNGVCG